MIFEEKLILAVIGLGVICCPIGHILEYLIKSKWKIAPYLRTFFKVLFIAFLAAFFACFIILLISVL